jgi:hypothetical protein
MTNEEAVKILRYVQSVAGINMNLHEKVEDGTLGAKLEEAITALAGVAGVAEEKKSL